MLFLFAFLLLVAVAFQCWVTLKLWKTEWFERKEKLAQSKLIWLLPILGAVMVYAVISDEDDHIGPTSHLKG